MKKYTLIIFDFLVLRIYSIIIKYLVKMTEAKNVCE